LDHSGIYYDARGPSDLESMLQTNHLSSAERDRAKRLRAHLLDNQLSKYNLGGEVWQRPEAASGKELVLVLGQVEGDASIRYGVPEDGLVRTNLELVRAARRAYPEAWIIYKPHPDILAGLRDPGTDSGRATQEWDDLVGKVSLESLFAVVDRVCTLTSLGGFEALLRGIPVSTWGLPFYAGWGLTDDRLGNHPWIAERRDRKLDLEELVHASLIAYPRYRSPRAGRLTTPENAVNELFAMRSSPMAMSLEQRIFRWWGVLKSLVRAHCLSKP
jgi:capsular polysaccharide export protein